MSTLVLNLDENLVTRLSAAAARSRKALPEWATEQLSRLVNQPVSSPAEAYSSEWQAAFGSIADASFEAPSRPLPRPVEPLDAE
jgi:hypothetical protein